MSYIKCTMFFTHAAPRTQPSGWSESHISLDTADLPAALVNLRALAGFRAGMLGTYVTVPYLRVSRLGVRNDSRVYPGLGIIPGPPERTSGAINQIADIPAAGILLRAEAADPDFIARRSIWIHGAPDGVQVIDQDATTNPALNLAYQNWKTELLSPRWGMMALDRTVSNPEVAIVDVNTVAPYTFTTGGNHGFARGDLVIIRGVRAAPANITGTFQIDQVPTPTSFSVIAPPVVTTYRGGGTVRKSQRIQLRYTSIEFRRYGTRRVGRPFDLSHGRR